MNFHKLINSFLSLLLLNVFWCGVSSANGILYGKDIKDQASEYFTEIGIEAEILTSDKRAFFSCALCFFVFYFEQSFKNRITELFFDKLQSVLFSV